MDRSTVLTIGLIMLICVMINMIICGAVGEKVGRSEVQNEAIERGYATWNVVDEFGKTEFKWKDTNEQTKR